MDHFPIYVRTAGRQVLVSGGGDAALAKLRLLLKTDAQVVVFSPAPVAAVEDLAGEGRLKLVRRSLEQADLKTAFLVYAADEDDVLDARTVAYARAAAVLVNHVDNLETSDFITPAIVDRAPVTVAIGTEGAAPVLARAIKAALEEQLSPALGTLAEIGKAFRTRAFELAPGRSRREFWAEYYQHIGPQAFVRGGAGAVQQSLEALLQRHLNALNKLGRIDLIGTGAGAADMLSLRARKAIDRADIIVADASVTGEVLELARREAQFLSASTPQAELIEKARNGAAIVRLKPGTGTPDGLIAEAIAAGIDCSILPGLPIAAPVPDRMSRATPDLTEILPALIPALINEGLN